MYLNEGFLTINPLTSS